MLQYQDNTQIFHIVVIYYIFAYLKIHRKIGRVGYDPMGQNIDLLVFNNYVEWTEIYREVEKELP